MTGLSVVVPAFNEARRIGRTIERLQQYLRTLPEPTEIIIVDDGSRDGTAAIVSAHAAPQPPVRLLQSAQNLGKGASVRRGVLAAAHQQVLFTDADLATPIEEVTKLRRALRSGADVAVASRRLAASDVQLGQPWPRRVAGALFSKLVSTLLLPGISDSQCGFKLFTHAAAQDLFSHLWIDGFSFDVELLVLARKRRYRVAEVPVVWKDGDQTHVRLLRDSLAMLRDVGRVRLRAARGAYDTVEEGTTLRPRRPIRRHTNTDRDGVPPVSTESGSRETHLDRPIDRDAGDRHPETRPGRHRSASP